MKPGVISKRLVEGQLILERKMLGAHQVLTLNTKRCVGCNICAITCPEEAAKLTFGTVKDGRLCRKPRADLDTAKCTFCGVCSVFCPTNAIQIEVNDIPTIPVVEAKVFPTLVKEIDVDIEKCKTSCNLACQNECPTKAVEVAFKGTGNGESRRIENVAIDRDSCIFCKKCESACPEKAMRVTKSLLGAVELNTDLCPNGCQVCLDVCPSKAISLEEGGKPKVEMEFCIYCGACQEVCPKEAISVKRTQILHSDATSGAWIVALEKLTSHSYLVKELSSRTRKKLNEALKHKI